MATKSDFAPIIASYALCIAAGAAVLHGLHLPEPWDALAADLLATLVIYAFSYRYKNSSFYDPYWSVIPPLLAVYWYCRFNGSFNEARALLAMVLVWLWAIRLTANWSVYWGGLHHEDWRYPIVRARAGKFAVLADLGGIHLFPTVQVFLGCLPLYALMSRGTEVPLGWLDALAFVVTLGAIAIELIADLQLHAFIARRRPGSFINTGLWAFSRHPNYFGELAFWWGLMLFGLAAAPEAWWWIVPGALAMTLMFVFVSVPFMDQRSVERRPAYAAHMKKVSALLPLPPRSIP